MLKLRYLFENFELARFALRNWPHDEASLEESLSWFCISSNAIYPYFDGDALCFLRLAPTGEKLERNVRGELEFIDYLLTAGFPALHPIPSLAGDTLLTLSTEWGDYYACAFARVPGKSLEDTPLDADILRECGATLGRMHSLSAAYEPEHKKWSHADALDWIAGVLREYNAPDCAMREYESVRALLASLPADKAVYGLVHYDYEPDNVYYDPQSRKCAVIDFDDGMYHWFALDVEQALDELCGIDCGLSGEQITDAFLGGYRSQHPFSAEQEQSRPVMRRFVDLFKYSRMIRALDERFDDEPDWLVGLRATLGSVVERLEAGMTELNG